MNFIEPFKGLSHRVWLLSMVNFINRCGAMIMCFLSLYITESLKYDLRRAGFAMAIYGIGAIFGQQLGGVLTDKIGYQRVQLGSLLATGILILVLMTVRDFYMLCFVLFVFNLVSEAFRPANSVAISSNSDDNTRTRSFSLLRISFNLAIMFALTAGGWLILQGWSYIFWVDAFTCFASAAVLFFFVPEVHRKSPKQAKSEKPTKPALSPYRDKLYMQFAIATFLGALVFMQIVWTIPPFFKKVYGWDEFTIGCISAVNGFTVMLVEMPLVHRIEGRYSTLWIVRLGLVIYALSYLILMLPISWAWVAAIAYMVLISFGEIFAMPFSITWATKRAPKSQEGNYMSVYGMSYAVANIFAPLVGTQLIYHFSYNTLWATMAIVAAIAAAWFYYLLSVESVESRA